jgi:hypothetical protein
MAWQDVLEVNQRVWEKISEIYPHKISLIDQGIPILLEHINQKEGLLKNQQLERLKSKFSKNGLKDICSATSEIFWFVHLISKGLDIIIEPDFPLQGPDCFSRINEKDIYFEVVSPTDVWERDIIMRKCKTLVEDLKKLNLPSIFLVNIQHIDPEFDDGDKRNIIKENVRRICLNPPNYEKFYLVWRKDDSIPFITANKFESNGYVIAFFKAKKFGEKENNIGFGDLVIPRFVYRSEKEFIKWATGALEGKLKEQLKPNRENYLVVDTPISLTDTRVAFEGLTKNISSHKERLDFLYGLFIIDKFSDKDNWVYKIELIPNSKIKDLISNTILHLCGEIKRENH